MPDARAFTGQMQVVEQLAQKALKENVTVFLTVEQYGSVEACQKRARSLQTSFSSFRARTRRLSGDEKRARDVFKQGPYDTLACLIDPLPNAGGWKFWLGQGSSLLDDLDVRGADGKPLTDFGANKSERAQFVEDVLPRAMMSPPQITKREWLMGERYGLWVTADGERWFNDRAPTEEEMRELDTLPTGD